MGTPLTFRTLTEVNTKQAKPGDRFYLEVAESLAFRGQVVVPAGAPAVAEVVRSEKNGIFGKKGTIEARLLYVDTPNGRVRLTGRTSDDGKDAGVWAIGGAVLVALPLGFIHGTSGYLRHGTPVTGYTAEEMPFFIQPPTPARSVAVVEPNDRALPASFDPGAFSGLQQASVR